MTPQEKIEELRAQYPQMFEHKELRKGEVCLGERLIDVVEFDVEEYRRQGLRSIRQGSGKMGKLKGQPGSFEFRPIFANALEVATLIIRLEAERAQPVSF